MQNYDDQIRQLTEQIAQLTEENLRLHARLDAALNSLDMAVNTIALQKEEIQRLKDEIAILKGQKPRPKIPPSSLEGSQSNGKKKDDDSRGKHPRRKKTNQLEIHATTRIAPEVLPEEAIFKGIQEFTVQDIIFQPHNTVYELERWMLPDGTYLTGKLPKNVQGHWGSQLVAYILHQYYGCRVTEGLLFAQLKEIGIVISEGQLSNILIQGKEAFHEEKNTLLSAGIAATGQIKVDDTGARHNGQNGYSTILGNEFFTSIVSTDSKSRINFLQILHGEDPQYLVNEDAVDYAEALRPTSWICGCLRIHTGDQAMDQQSWDEFLRERNIVAENDIKLLTEAALFASLIKTGIPKNLGVHGDDAGQFDAFVRSLCWIHEERHYRKILPVDDEMRLAIEKIREGIWELYRGLKEYKRAPCVGLKVILKQKFEDLFKSKTSSPTLNNQLAKTYAKKDELLRVLERPETPLHNNDTETDAREMVVKRKVSGGTRSSEGRKCRDTFVSLKRTCIKLKISFYAYLQDRVNGLFKIPKLALVIAERANNSS